MLVVGYNRTSKNGRKYSRGCDAEVGSVFHASNQQTRCCSQMCCVYSEL